MRHRDGAHDPGGRQPADAAGVAVDDAVDDGEVVNVENDAGEVAADEDDDDAEQNRRQVEIWGQCYKSFLSVIYRLL